MRTEVENNLVILIRGLTEAGQSDFTPNVALQNCITGTSLAPIELTRICLEILFSFDDVLYMKRKDHISTIVGQNAIKIQLTHDEG